MTDNTHIRIDIRHISTDDEQAYLFTKRMTGSFCALVSRMPGNESEDE
jgi:hypothetical protein